MNVGLIGLGRHGMRYARHLIDDPSLPTLTAICRAHVHESRTFAQTHHLALYEQHVDLIRDPKVDAVVVVTPPSFNLLIAREAILHEKPVLIEKPLAVSASDAREMVSLATRAHVPIMTAHTLRFDPVIAALTQQADTIRPWRSLSLTAHVPRRPKSMREAEAWNGRGVLLEVGVHLVDLAKYLTQEPMTEACCEVRCTERTQEDDREDHAWGRVTTASGLPCLFEVSRTGGARMTRVELVGASSTITADCTHSTIRVCTGSGSDKNREQAVERAQTIPRVLDAFARALETNNPMPVTGADGWYAVRLIDACYESAKTGAPVSLEDG